MVSELDKQDLAQLLQFVTGTSKVPLEGFKALQGVSGPQRFQIHKAYGAGEGLRQQARRVHDCAHSVSLLPSRMCGPCVCCGTPYLASHVTACTAANLTCPAMPS